MRDHWLHRHSAPTRFRATREKFLIMTVGESALGTGHCEASVHRHAKPCAVFFVGWDPRRWRAPAGRWHVRCGESLLLSTGLQGGTGGLFSHLRDSFEHRTSIARQQQQDNATIANHAVGFQDAIRRRVHEKKAGVALRVPIMTLSRTRRRVRGPRRHGGAPEQAGRAAAGHARRRALLASGCKTISTQTISAQQTSESLCLGSQIH